MLNDDTDIVLSDDANPDSDDELFTVEQPQAVIDQALENSPEPEVQAQRDAQDRQQKKRKDDRKAREDFEQRAPFLANEVRNEFYFYRTRDGRIYCNLGTGALLITSTEFRNFLTHKYVELTNGKAPSAGLVTSAITLLQTNAEIQERDRVVVRLASERTVLRGTEQECLYLDLDNRDGTVMMITKDGWFPGDDPDRFLFRHPKHMAALPEPLRGGSLEELRQFLNLPDDDAWLLYQGFLLMVFNPFDVVTEPILLLNGPPGSAKSTTARLTSNLVDPSTSPSGHLRAMPKDERDLLIATNNTILPVFDNVSRLNPWLSDAFCRLATGAALGTRTLFSDSDETVFTGKRPVIITGIEDIATRNDFLDRTIIITLPVISPDQRRDEHQLKVAFEEARPRILGALLDKVVTALRNYPKTALVGLPRLSNFAIWGTAGLDDGKEGRFYDAYLRNIATARKLSLGASILATAVLQFAKGRDSWTGTASELLTALNRQVSQEQQRSKAWPPDATRLSSALRRAQADLLGEGVHITFDTDNTRERRAIEIRTERRR
jgi:hypothetical protein